VDSMKRREEGEDYDTLRSDAVTTRLREGDTVMTRPRPTPGRRRSHDSPEANTRRETQSQLSTTYPRAGDAVTARHDSPEGGRRSHVSSRLARGREML
jgi:hypothetical protein